MKEETSEKVTVCCKGKGALGTKNDEDVEADEDLAIAYEAMNDWEDFEDL